MSLLLLRSKAESVDALTTDNKAWIIDGVDEYIKRAHTSALNITDELSIEVVVKISSISSSGYIFTNRVPGGGPRTFYLFYTQNNKVQFNVLDNDGVSTILHDYEVDLGDDTWHQLGLTFSAGTLKTYVDGAEVASTVVINNPVDSLLTHTQAWSVGALNNGASGVNATVARVCVWKNAVITEAEYAELWNGGSITVPTISHKAYTSPNDLVLCWQMQSTDSTAANGVLDTSGNALHGTTTNMEASDLVDYQAAGRSVIFDGVDEYIDLGNTNNITDNFSLSLWIRGGGGVDYAAIMGKYFDTDRSWFLRAQGPGSPANNKLEFFTYPTNSSSPLRSWASDVEILDSTWHHFVITYASGTITAYLDGGTTTGTTTGTATSIQSTTTPMRIASYETVVTPGNQYMTEVALFDTQILSAADVSALYNSGTPKDATTITYSGSQNLVGYWKLNEGDSLTTASGVADQSGNGNHGTAQNMEASDLAEDIPQ